MTRVALVLAVTLAAGATPARADEPTWRYGAAFAFGIDPVAGRGYDELELTLHGSRRIAGPWRIAAHAHKLALSRDALTGDGHRLGLGLERSFARYEEPGGGAATASLRAGLTRETVHWDRGRLDRGGAYLELRGIIDFDLTRGARPTRLFGMGLALRGYVNRTPALLADGPVAAAGAPARAPHYDLGFLIAWEWTASR